MNTFEIVVTEVEGELKVDQAYFVTRKDQCEYSAQGRWKDRADESSPLRAVKTVFPSFDFLGWYSVGSEPTPEDMSLHKQVSDETASC